MIARHSRLWVMGGALAVCAWAYLGGGLRSSVAAEGAVRLPAPAFDMPATPNAAAQTAVFA
ncbi:MAG TPA: hypothetical protein VFG60_03380, partial [Burkholderiaceae bacterium]|nr:hypothetical protein [Burkholderiaceae bacterium]